MVHDRNTDGSDPSWIGDELCQALALTPSPETMVEIWLSDAEDLLMELADDPSDPKILFRVLAARKRLQRCQPKWMVLDVAGIVKELDRAVANLDDSQAELILSQIAFEHWIAAANELEQRYESTETPDPMWACDLLEGLDDADLVIATFEEHELASPLRIQFDDCLLWLRRHPLAWELAANWIVSVAQTFASDSELEPTGLLGTTHKYLLWVSQLAESIDREDMAPFDRLSDQDLRTLFAQFQSERIRRIVVKPQDWQTQRASDIEYAISAGSESAEEFFADQKDQSDEESAVFELPVDNDGVLSIERFGSQYKAYFVCPKVPPTPPPLSCKNAAGESLNLVWMELKGGKSYHTKAFDAVQLVADLVGGPMTIDLVAE